MNSWTGVRPTPIPAGLMPEQVDDKGNPLSVLPLAWSHSAYVLAVLEYLQALEKKSEAFPALPEKNRTIQEEENYNRKLYKISINLSFQQIANELYK